MTTVRQAATTGVNYLRAGRPVENSGSGSNALNSRLFYLPSGVGIRVLLQNCGGWLR